MDTALKDDCHTVFSLEQSAYKSNTMSLETEYTVQDFLRDWFRDKHISNVCTQLYGEGDGSVREVYTARDGTMKFVVVFRLKAGVDKLIRVTNPYFASVDAVDDGGMQPYQGVVAITSIPHDEFMLALENTA
jgi:hypothetical protein